MIPKRLAGFMSRRGLALGVWASVLVMPLTIQWPHLALAQTFGEERAAGAQHDPPPSSTSASALEDRMGGSDAAAVSDAPELGKAIQQVQSAKLQVQQQLVNLQHNQQTLQQELAARAQQVEVLESRSTYLTRQLQDRGATLQQLQHDLDAGHLEVSALAEQRRQLDDTRARLTQDQDALVQQRDRVEAQQRQYDNLKRSLADAEHRANQVAQQLDQQREATLKVNGELVRVKQQVQALEADAKSLRDLNRLLKDDQRRLTRETPKTEQAHLKELARVNQQLSDAKLAEQQAGAKVDHLTRVLRDRDQLIQALKRTVNQQEVELRRSGQAAAPEPIASQSPLPRVPSRKSKAAAVPAPVIAAVKVLEVDPQLGLVVFSARDLEQAREGDWFSLSVSGRPVAKVQLGEIDEHGMVVAHIRQRALPTAVLRKGDLVEATRLTAEQSGSD